jgi:hypothetical protein
VDVSVIPKKNDIDKTGINDDIERYEQQSITGKRQKPKSRPREGGIDVAGSYETTRAFLWSILQ